MNTKCDHNGITTDVLNKQSIKSNGIHISKIVFEFLEFAELAMRGREMVVQHNTTSVKEFERRENWNCLEVEMDICGFFKSFE